ncbi:MAG: M56 family metallopeptidase, partial [Deltaproteobacteria bacterium]
MSRLLSLDAEFCRQLALVLFHVTWSGTLLAGAAALVARQASPRAPAVKYWIHFGALLGILLLAPFWGMRVRSLSPVDRQSSPVVTAVDLPALCEPATLSEPVALGIGASLPAATETAADGIFSPPQTTAAAPPPANRFNWHELALRVVTLCYLSGAMCMLLRLLAALGGGERLRLAGTPVRDVALIDLLAEQSRRLGLRAVPLLRICERTAVPVVVGALRPAILIPATMITGLDPGQLAGVLMHELAHIRRYDHLFLLLQRFIEAVLFFHPAVWYLSRCVHADREDCCDDLVLAGGGDPLEYAGALVRVAELRLRPTRVVRPAGALAADGHRPSDLRRRIARVLGVEPQPVVRLPKAGLLALLLPAVAGTAVACAQLAAAPQSGSPRSG